jgi:hypothetical protein
MSDVLDNERGPAPMWVVPVAMLAVVLVFVALAWRSGGSDDTSRPVVSFAPGASPTPEPTQSVGRAANECGNDVEQPLVDAGPLPPETGLRLLVGDQHLLDVDVDTGGATAITTRTDARSFTQLAANGDDVVAVLGDRCRPDGFGKGEVGIVDQTTGAITSKGRGDEILPGSPMTVLMYAASGPTRLRELNSRQTTPMPADWAVYARNPSSYFVSVGGSDASHPPVLGIGSPAGAKLTKTFGGGSIVGASSQLLFWLAGDCPGDVHCLLTWTTAEGTNTAQQIDTNAWGGVASPDGTKLAFRKARASGRLGDHPGPPNDVAVLDTKTGEPAKVLPGLVLPAKAGLTLTWSPDNQWLVMGADLGTGPLVLIWREGMARPARVPIPGVGGTTGPPALLVLPQGIVGG